MFRRVFFEQWHGALAVVLFLAVFLLFVAWIVGVLRMKKDTVERLARQPLRDDETPVAAGAETAAPAPAGAAPATPPPPSDATTR
jgi:hypothetical protein